MEFSQKYPGEYNCRIEIIGRTGRRLAAHTAFPKGNRFNPLTDREVEDKFRNLTSPELGERQCDRTLELVWSLDKLTSLDDLFDSLVV